MSQQRPNVSHVANVHRVNPEMVLAAKPFKRRNSGFYDALEARLRLQVLVSVQPPDGGHQRLLGVRRKVDLALPGVHGSLP